jgi:hypothetical protein
MAFGNGPEGADKLTGSVDDAGLLSPNSLLVGIIESQTEAVDGALEEWVLINEDKFINKKTPAKQHNKLLKQIILVEAKLGLQEEN